MRFNTDGTVDTSFGSSGLATADFGGASNDYAAALAIDSQGRIVVVGSAGNDFGVARFTSNGSADNTFDTDGKLVTDFSGGTDQDPATGVIVLATGKIVVSGTNHSTTSQVALARYNDDGSLDTGFSGDGKLVTGFLAATYGYRVALAAGTGGKVLVSGINNGNFAIASINPDGSTDTSFGGGDGVVTADLVGTDYALSLVVQADGKIVAGGSNYNGATTSFGLARFTADGVLDTSFSGDGVLLTTFGVGNSLGYDVAVGYDGRIVLVGEAGGDFAVAAYDGGRMRLYAQQDANFNVTSVTDAYGGVQERYLYDPYGAVTYKTAAWGSRASSSYDWRYLHQGLRYDATVTLYDSRRRPYDPDTGRFTAADPIGYGDGMNVYQAYGSGPITNIDPLGEDDAKPSIDPNQDYGGATGITPQEEFDQLVAAAKAWNKTSPPYAVNNQCADQANGLMNYLRSLNRKHWNVTSEGGWNGLPKYGYHHVTLLIPKASNPMGSMVIDPFKSDGSTSSGVGTMPGQQFRGQYPHSCGCCTGRHTLPTTPSWFDSIEKAAKSPWLDPIKKAAGNAGPIKPMTP